MWGRCESAASEAPCIQVRVAVHLSISMENLYHCRKNTDEIPSKRRDVESKCYFSGYVWRPSIVVENWSAVALPATSCSPSRKIRSVSVGSRQQLLRNLSGLSYLDDFTPPFVDSGICGHEPGQPLAIIPTLRLL